MSTPTAEDLAELAKDVSAAALLKGDFVLRSGRRSNFYLDKYLFETEPTVLRRVAHQLAARLPAGTERIAGPELGAVALATAVSLESGIPFMIIRKASKEYGASAGKPFEGKALKPGEKVVVIEDVITTGGEAIRSATLLKELGAEVIEVLCVLERGEGVETLRGMGFPTRALFTGPDIGMPAA